MATTAPRPAIKAAPPIMAVWAAPLTGTEVEADGLAVALTVPLVVLDQLPVGEVPFTTGAAVVDAQVEVHEAVDQAASVDQDASDDQEDSLG